MGGGGGGGRFQNMGSDSAIQIIHSISFTQKCLGFYTEVFPSIRMNELLVLMISRETKSNTSLLLKKNVGKSSTSVNQAQR